MSSSRSYARSTLGFNAADPELEADEVGRAGLSDGVPKDARNCLTVKELGDLVSAISADAPWRNSHTSSAPSGRRIR